MPPVPWYTVGSARNESDVHNYCTDQLSHAEMTMKDAKTFLSLELRFETTANAQIHYDSTGQEIINDFQGS